MRAVQRNFRTAEMGESETREKGPFRGETELIANLFEPLARDYDGSLGLMDDAALLTPAPGEELVLTADMLVAGVHFLGDAAPADAAFKALAVNVSDLIAKGAAPEIYLLTIALPGKPDRAWLSGLTDGFADAQAAFGCVLAGGDTVSTPGPLTLSITAIGRLPDGGMVRRSGARAGDRVYVTGTIGDAAAGLNLLRDRDGAVADAIGEENAGFLASRYWRPQPNPRLATVLREHASAAMDISDGLAGDFAKLCSASACAGTIEADRVPCSDAVLASLEAGLVRLEDLLSGGDDYEVLASVPEEKCAAFERAVAMAGSRATALGEMSAGAGAELTGIDGKPMRFSQPGYDHF